MYKDELASFMFINLKELTFTPIPLKNDEAYLAYMYTSKHSEEKTWLRIYVIKVTEFLKKWAGIKYIV